MPQSLECKLCIFLLICKHSLNIFPKQATTRVERTQGVFENTINLEHQDVSNEMFEQGVKKQLLHSLSSHSLHIESNHTTVHLMHGVTLVYIHIYLFSFGDDSLTGICNILCKHSRPFAYATLACCQRHVFQQLHVSRNRLGR